MKLRPFLTLLLILTFVSKVGAVDGVIDEVLGDSSESSTRLETGGDTENTLSWPAIPGESLNDIARAFYPKSSTMRRLFVRQTIKLNPGLEPALKPSRIFEEPTLLTIPSLKTLSKSKQARNAQRKKTKRQQLKMSFSMDKAISKIPALLQQEYESLLSKNAFLKAELERLHQKINDLQTQLSNLKLVFDKTLSLPENQASQTSNTSKSPMQTAGLADTQTQTQIQPKVQPEIKPVTNASPARKTFKNLNETSTNAVKTAAQQVKPLTQPTVITSDTSEDSSAPSSLLNYVLLVGSVLLALLALSAFLARRSRQRALTHFKQSIPLMDDTITDYGGQWQDTEQGSEYTVEHEPQASTKNFMNTEMRNDQAKASSTLEEAKLLMTMNRTQDAIDHLKLSIETHPKTSINHWLYLLEIYRKLNAKEDFETYAQSLHRTFNVMTPVWYETNVAIVVPQHLEEFPHIIDKLDAVWPSDLAKVYLESLITDNRDGERAGFSKAVLDEILMLIALLESRQDFD